MSNKEDFMRYAKKVLDLKEKKRVAGIIAANQHFYDNMDRIKRRSI